MATLILSAAGAVAGGALLPAGVNLLGTGLSGAVLGRAAGAVAGRYIDQALFGASGQNRVVENTGARLADLQVTSSSEGAVIPRIFGRARLGGQIIWATHFEEEVLRDSETYSGGGKGLSGPSQTTVTTSYRYYANFAVVLCEGEISTLGRVWADGKEINLADYTFRLYRGDEEQQPDSLIEAKEGTGNAPAYRGLAYVVFERLPLEGFGNRLPQLNFEVFKALDDVERQITAVTLIPGSGEFAYEVEPVERDAGQGETLPENVHHRMGGTDWSLSLDQLQDMMPNCGSVSLFVSWFGTDLRAADCQLMPGVENRDKATSPYSWKVAGMTRADAHLVSQLDERPVYGGTPSDRSVIAAIQDLKSRGFEVTFNPFLLMDIPPSNGLPDPYGAAEQAAFPWRGRISCDPAPGETGSPDKNVAAATQIEAFVGACQVGDFALSGDEVIYTGAPEWSWRRMVLHYAHLCALAGGVDAFLLGSELRGLTQVRDGASTYPFVAALQQLAADVKTVLGSGTKVSYAADWSEYFGHQPADGSGDVYFNLDPFWASDAVDMIALDCYWPLADWRDEENHLDREAGWLSTYDPAYLRRNLAGGEGYDWYYAAPQDRDQQIRTPITDGAGKPWVFRYKDLAGWWNALHYDRPGGTEAASPTGWVPRSKPFWLMEVGCPAIDKGANEPNRFIDTKSAESALPHFSRGTRDDSIQRRYLQAYYEAFDPLHQDFDEALNPFSDVYGGRMVEHAKIHAYTWDARPYPAFPYNRDAWSDGANWLLGHWLNGRMAGGPLQAVIDGIFGAYEFADYELSPLHGMMEGYILDDIMSAREALQPLEMAFFLDSYESGGKIRLAHKGQRPPVAELDVDGLVDQRESGELFSLVRAQETDLPRTAKLTYVDGILDYRQAVVEVRRHDSASSRVATAQLPVVMGQAQAQATVDSWLHDVWSAREKASFSLPPSWLGVDPGDVVRLSVNERQIDFRVSSTALGDGLVVECHSLQPHIYRSAAVPSRDAVLADAKLFGPSLVEFVDLPLLQGDETATNGYVAAYQAPWPGAVNFFRTSSQAGYALAARVDLPAVTGDTLSVLDAGPVARWDRANDLEIQLYSGALISRERLDVLAGANLAAVEHPGGLWEVMQFQTAELIGERSYRLSGLLRGQAGTEAHMSQSLPSGARFLLLDDALTPVALTSDEIGIEYYWKVGPAPYDIGHRSYTDHQSQFVGLGLKPFAPVHLRAARDAAGDIQITWIRRTRSGGDAWREVEVPLGEDQESYKIEILDNGEVARTLTATSASIVYGAAQENEDFGVPQTALEVIVYQLSAAIGRGHGARKTLSL